MRFLAIFAALTSCVALSACKAQTTVVPPIGPAGGGISTPTVVASTAIKETDARGFVGNRKTNSFYYSFKVEAIGAWKDKPPSNDDCLADGFWAWARRLFKEDTVSVSLVLEVDTAVNGTLKMPLFEASRAESGGQCYLYFEPRTVTPVYLAQQGDRIGYRAVLVTKTSSQVRATEKLLDAVEGLLPFIGGSAWIISKLAGDAVEKAAEQVDKSIASANTSSRHQVIGGEIKLFPGIGDTPTQDSGFKFDIPDLQAGVGGITVTSSVPRLRFFPVIEESLFADNSASYPPYSTVLARPLPKDAAPNRMSVGALLREGPGGVSVLGNARTLTTADQYNELCRRINGFTAPFLVIADQLAVRYAVLRNETEFSKLPEILDAYDCFTADHLSALKSMNSEYNFDFRQRVLDDTKARNDEVRLRWDRITEALTSWDETALRAVVTSPGEFVLDAPDNLLPKLRVEQVLEGEDTEQGFGLSAIRRLAGAKIAGVSCYRTLNAKRSLLTMIALARVGSEVLAVVANFSGDYSANDEAANIEAARKVTSLRIMPVARALAVYNVSSVRPREWPSRSTCSWLKDKAVAQMGG